MANKTVVLAAVVVLGALVAAGIVLDTQRRSDPEYQKKLKERRRAAKAAAERAAKEAAEAAQMKPAASKANMPDKTDPAKVKEFFMAEMSAGQDALEAGDLMSCAAHFANAITVSEHPIEMIMFFKQQFPEVLFDAIMRQIDPDLLRDKYFDTFPGAITDTVSIEVVEGSTKQRVVLATKDIAEGEVLADEVPFAAAFEPTVATSELCFQCHKKLPGKPVQCREKCHVEHYCTAKCRDVAWDQGHSLVCGTGKQSKVPQAIKQLDALCKETGDCEAQVVASLLARVFASTADPDVAGHVAHLHYSEPLATATDTRREEAKHLRDALREKVTEIDEVVTEDSYMAMLSKVQQNCISFGSGKAVYLLGSYFNHACEPNMSVTFDGSKAQYVALKEIKAGEEVTRAYTDVSGQDTKERVETIKKTFGFECECNACMGKLAPAH